MNTHLVWAKKSEKEIKARIFEALGKNINFGEQTILGVPASYLDEKVFSQDVSFLADSPFISTLVQNPNHIGCHTLGKSESFFPGTQEIERELIQLCACDILKALPGETDGYVASGGTEANLQALWIYRNYFRQKHNASLQEICILTSNDSHYSMDKGANLLSVSLYKTSVSESTREISEATVDKTIQAAVRDGKKYFIVVANMMTTLFGSVDDFSIYTRILKKNNLPFTLHIDGAFGGFYYPFTECGNRINFSNPDITSFTLDAHKMAQAPYGTGLFLIRKGWIDFTKTKQASYVKGEDTTLSGSRSGANAVSVWMILMKHGPFGWEEKIMVLQKRADWLCKQLQEKKIEYYRHPCSNIVTIKSKYIPASVASAFGLVPDDHHNPAWYKIVIMNHVTIEKLGSLIEKLK